jgi:hypothetical protein
MFRKVIGYAKDIVQPPRGTLLFELRKFYRLPNVLNRLDFPLEHKVFQLPQEFFDVLEVPVN